MGEIAALGVSGKIELLATDLDGTLLTSRNEVSERTKQALVAAHEHGILVVPATGRGSVSARRVLAELDWLQWFITSNGAVIEDASGGERPTVRAIPAEVSHAVIDQLRSCSDDYTFAWLTDEGFGAEHNFKRLHGAFLGRRQVVLTPGFNPDGVDVVKILVGGPDRNEKRLLASITADLEHMDDSANVSVAGSDAAFVEITAQGVDKGSALELLCGRLGVEASRVVAVGDQHNDVQMLAWAGCSVAMANGVASVHQISDLTTKNNDEDGVAHVIESLLGESLF